MTDKKAKLRHILYLILLSTVLLGGCSIINQEERQVSVGEMTNDLINFQATLMQTHPMLQTESLDAVKQDNERVRLKNMQIKQEIIDDFASLRQSLTKDTSPEDLVWALKKIVSKLGDEHTHVNMTTDQRTLPVRFKFTSDGLVTADDHALIPKGSLVKKINGKPVSDVLEALKSVSPQGLDNVLYGGIISNHLYTQNYLEHLGLLGPNDTVQLEFISGRGQETLSSLTLGRYKFPMEDNYAYHFDQASSTGQFVIKNYMNVSEFEKVWAAFMDEYRVMQPQNLLIDVRQSVGGMDEYYITDTILSAIGVDTYKTPYPGFYKEAYQQAETVVVTKHYDPISVDNLYVAISNYTISAPTIFAATVKENNLGTVIGQPVANNLDFYASGSYVFEHLPIQAGISGFKLEYAGSEAPTDHPLQPDISLPLYAKHIQADIDPVIDWIEHGQVASD